MPGPRGGAWSQGTINGNRKRGTGILNNELYIGALIWNRSSYVKDPDTKKRHSRANTPDKIECAEVPQQRIVESALWDGVTKRLAAGDEQAKPAVDGSTFQSKQRPKYLLSGLTCCGICGAEWR